MAAGRAVREVEHRHRSHPRTSAPLAPPRSAGSPGEAILDLQRSVGNRAVVSLLQAGGRVQVQRWTDQRRGSTGIKVRMIQRLLNRSGAVPELVDDGIFGSRTRAAVKDFQRMIFVKQTGIVDARTWASLQAGGRGSATSQVAAMGRALLIVSLANLSSALLQGARALQQTPDAARARVVLRRLLGKARLAYRAAAGVTAANTAFSVRQRRGAQTMREITLLAEVLPATAPVADPRVLSGALEQAGQYAALFAVVLGAQPPEQFVATAPGVVAALGRLVFGLSRTADGLAAAAARPRPATVGP